MQERACRALQELVPQVSGEEYDKIKAEAGRDLMRLMQVYDKMTSLGVVGAVTDALRQHPESVHVAADASRVISFLARADACQNLIAQDMDANGQGTCACVLHSMRLHERDPAVNAWGCRALQNIADNHLGNALMIVRAGGPSAILNAMHHAPGDRNFLMCACQALGSLVLSEPFSPDFIVDQQAIQTLLDVMQRNGGNAQTEGATPSGSFCFEYSCSALIKIGTSHRNLLACMKTAGVEQYLYDAMTLPSASARVKELAPKLLDLLDGAASHRADVGAPSAPTLPAQSSASAVVDGALVFESAPMRAAFCGKCGQPISSDNSFCIICGAPVGR